MAEPDLTPVCRKCGGEASGHVKAWYPVPQGQGITIWPGKDGEWEIDYDGCTRDGDAGDNEDYWCDHCSASAEKLEDLIETKDAHDIRLALGSVGQGIVDVLFNRLDGQADEATLRRWLAGEEFYDLVGPAIDTLEERYLEQATQPEAPR